MINVVLDKCVSDGNGFEQFIIPEEGGGLNYYETCNMLI